MKDATFLPRWTNVWADLGCEGDPRAWRERLIAAYAEPHRAYHNLQHLAECFAELDAARSLATHPAEVEIALWFHDAVYDAPSKTNEEDSADLAAACLGGAGIRPPLIDYIRQLILCTKTHQPGALADAALLIDIDLSILGKPPARFADYEQAIREEYRWVTEATYREKRAEVLARFLARPAIYATAHFREKYEASARHNLSASIAALS